VFLDLLRLLLYWDVGSAKPSTLKLEPLSPSDFNIVINMNLDAVRSMDKNFRLSP